MNNVIGECPICESDLVVTKLKCTHCSTEIGGSFQLSKFNYLYLIFELFKINFNLFYYDYLF